MKKKFAALLSVIAFLICFTLIPLNANAAGLEVQMSDVWTVVKNCIPYLSVFVVFLAVVIIALFKFRNKEKPLKKLIHGEAVIAIILALIVTLNAVCLGPVSSLLDLVFTPVGQVDENTANEAKSLITELGEEGSVLVKNDGTLPLSTDTKTLNVFGWASTNPIYGGTGSGSVDTSTAVTLLDGLKSGGYTLNDELINMYKSYAENRPEVGMSEQDWTLPEPTSDYYSSDLMNNAKEFSDTAVIVIGRGGGEGADLPSDFGTKNEDGSLKYTFKSNSDDYADFEAGEHYLELSKTEKNMVDTVCKNFDKVIVIYNGANAFELGWVNDYSQIRSVLLVPGAGETGFTAVGKILNGEVNPSAKLSDTYVYDLTKTPTYNNFGNFIYDNMDEFKYAESNPFTGTTTLNDVHFVNYVENIYVGYKFYETAFAEMQVGNMDYDYDSAVQFPFGYGLSYTTFSQKITNFVDSDGTIQMEVTVTNTGNVAGKDVVELYYTPPYSNEGIEKSSVNLLEFGKSQLLEPGASEKISFTIDKDDMASFDTYGNGCYVLEGGEYNLSIRSDSHTVLDSVDFTIDSTVVYDESNPRGDDQTAAVRQFEFAESDVLYLSRANGFANYDAATAKPTNYSMDEERKANYVNSSNYDPTKDNVASDVMPTTGASNDILLKDLRGLDYNDPKWDELLDKLSVSDMTTLIAEGGYQTTAIASVQKVATTDNDGPATIYNNYTKATGSAYPSEVMIANTWNKELALKMGQSIGKQADEMDVSGWYAPAMNTHRSAFAGRNFEYYSEDGILGGYLAAYEIQGANEYGVYSYIKHFALNDQEENRFKQLCTWATEQAIREIYLKPFELAVKVGKNTAVMNAHSYIGDIWTGACYSLNTSVLREEWGFKGMVLTDMFAGYGFYDADRAIRTGTDLMLNPMGSPDATLTDTSSATSVIAMRKASHNILYTVVNSRSYSEENIKVTMASWKKFMIAIDIVLVGALIGSEVLLLKRYKKRAQK